MSEAKRIFNNRLSRARRFIECSFGILSNKWRSFHGPLNVKIGSAIDIIKACVILHNFVRRRDGFSHEDSLSYEGLLENDETEIMTSVRSPGRGPIAVRDYFTNYFVSDAKLSWQLSKI